MTVVGAGVSSASAMEIKIPSNVALSDSQDTEGKQTVTIIFLLKQLQSEYKH